MLCSEKKIDPVMAFSSMGRYLYWQQTDKNTLRKINLRILCGIQLKATEILKR